MARDPLDKYLIYVQPDSRLDLKNIALDRLLAISSTEAGIKALLKNEQILQSILELTCDFMEEVCKVALLILVNITAYPYGAMDLLKYKYRNKKNVLELFIGYAMDPHKKDADAACMILSNITKVESTLNICIDTFLPVLSKIFYVFANINFNQTGSNLHYLAPTFKNLSQSPRMRKWLTQENSTVRLHKLLPFCNFESSVIRRGGVIGTIRNLSFDTKCHAFLLKSNLNLLNYLLKPIIGGAQFSKEEMDKLPISVKFLPRYKQREPEVDIRKMIIEILNKLCADKLGQEVLRKNGVYYILREYKKWEKNPSNLLVCRNAMNILNPEKEEGEN